jgi:hypothetical protein
MLMNKLFAKVALGALALVSVGSLAHADIVTFSTVGKFGSTGTNSISGGGLTLMFDQLPVTNSVDTAPFGSTNTSLGDFDLNVSNPSSSFTMTDTFTLTVNQTIPGPGGSKAFGVGTVSGTVSVSSSSATVTFTAPLVFVIDGTAADITYELLSTTVPIVPVSTNNGLSSVQAEVISIDHAPTVPTPASVLSGSALLGLMAASKLRSRRNAV